MKLVNVTVDEEVVVGLKTDIGILDVSKASKNTDIPIPSTMKGIIEQNDIDALEKLADLSKEDDTLYIEEKDMTYAPILTNPEKILCVGLNYLKHVDESPAMEVPTEPVLFSKFNNALAAHEEEIPLPQKGEKFDYEVELVVVIGKEVKNISAEDAMDAVFGYSVGNDLSVRDLQFVSGQWLIGKSTDKFAPVGPYLVTADEVDPHNLEIFLKRNGEIKQKSHTSHMIFDIPKVISYASELMTLKPGDLIFTGTPDGVILGQPENEQVWLQKGDVLEATVENIGTLVNTFI